MMKRWTALVLCFILLLSAACNKKTAEQPEEPKDEVQESAKIPTSLNPLTGLYEYDGILNIRPVAVMINNDVRAQDVQAGLPDADIIYETEIEGGETRLMAVFQDAQKVENIGTIRSSRYAYIDLAMGHNAIYIHRGCDKRYAGPHLNDLDHIDIHEGNYGYRPDNGLSLEHTLYAKGEKLWSGVSSKFKTTLEDVQPWQTFAKDGEKITLAGGKADKVTVAFSGNFKSIFVYDKQTGLYERNFKDKVPTEYLTKKSTNVKNVVVCLTKIEYYPDKSHRKIPLESGEGYYATNGTFQKIKWSKGDSSSSLKFTKEDGSEVVMSAGNTWVCFASSNYSVPTFE